MIRSTKDGLCLLELSETNQTPLYLTVIDSDNGQTQVGIKTLIIRNWNLILMMHSDLPKVKKYKKLPRYVCYLSYTL